MGLDSRGPLGSPGLQGVPGWSDPDSRGPSVGRRPLTSGDEELLLISIIIMVIIKLLIISGHGNNWIWEACHS